MELKRTPVEELVFTVAGFEAIMGEAGFALGQSDPQAIRDLSYRARYLRMSSGPEPRLYAYLEYYLAARAFSLKISPAPEDGNEPYRFLVKNHKGSLKELLEGYFAAVRNGALHHHAGPSGPRAR
ncbi:MAG: hypothetical protein OEW15_09785 [Nitrospirota bacterium]|nr:hypothetical protein [Nitrospirota bacterium]